MAGADAHVIRFQCPKCGHELEQTIGSLKLSDHMRCRGCGSFPSKSVTELIAYPGSPEPIPHLLAALRKGLSEVG